MATTIEYSPFKGESSKVKKMELRKLKSKAMIPGTESHSIAHVLNGLVLLMK